MTTLAGRTVLVTGASSGIGAAIAARCATFGARLILFGRDRSRLRDCERRLATQTTVRGHVVDFADAHGLAAASARIAGDCDRLDAIVHAAGRYASTPLAAVAPDALAELLQVNVTAALTLTRAFLPLLERDGGDVIVINSTIVARAARDLGPYAATKLALKGLTDTLREEVAGKRIRVTSLYPGRTATPMQADVHAIEGKAYRPERLLQPEDVAALVTFALTLPATAELIDATIRPALPPVAN